MPAAKGSARTLLRPTTIIVTRQFCHTEVLSYNDTVIQGTIMCWLCHTGRPPQSVASCRLSARHILKKAILQAYLSKTTHILMIYKGRHIFSNLSMPGTLLDCGSLVVAIRFVMVTAFVNF